MTSAPSSRGASFDRVFDAIQAANGGGRIERGSDYVKVCCPAHGDSHPSCSVRYDPVRGKTTVKCFVCPDDTLVLAAAGLTVADLFDEPRSPVNTATAPQRRRRPTGPPPTGHGGSAAGATASKKKPGKKDDGLRRRQVCEYLYPYVDGTKNGKVIRFDLVDETGTRAGKSFKPMRFDADSRRWCTGAFEPVLYRAPEVAAAIVAGELVYLTEGEDDADAGVELGGTATTNAGGAVNFTAELARQLAGARVVAVLDRDLAGYERGVRLGELLFGDEPVAELRLVEAAEGNDLADHRDRGHSLQDLVDVVDPAAKYVAATPDAVDKAVAKARAQGKPETVIRQIAEKMLSKAQAMLDKITLVVERPELEALLEQASATHVGAPEDELAKRRQQRQQKNAEVGTFVEDDPEFSIPTSSGTWAYSTGQFEVPRGVYRGSSEGYWQMVAPLPHVLERLTRRDGQARRRGISYRLAMRPLADATDVAIVGDEEVKDGSWAELLDVPLAADDKIVKAVASAIRHTAREHAPLSEITPGWTRDEQFVMPSADVLGGGYGELIGTEANARAVWAEVAEVAGRNPKVALALGASLGGLFVKPLLIPVRSFWLHMCGDSQAGKSTTQLWTAALYGAPSSIIETWDSSGKGTTYRYGELACLPVFQDELGSSRELKSPDARQQAILAILEGNKRRVATRIQGSRNSPPWHASLLSTGNPSLLEGISDEAVWARVIEVEAPITDSAEDCVDLQHLLTPEEPEHADTPVVRRLADHTQASITKAYGWPLHWLRQDLSLDRFRDHLAAARRDLPLPPNGVPKTMGHNLSMVIAGAAELDHILGTTTLRPAALAAGRETLGKLLDELQELGAKPSQRLHAAVIQALVSRVSSYPTRSMVVSAFPDSDSLNRTLLPRDVEGFLIANDPDVEGDIAILTHKLRDIAAAAGISDTRPGLRQLAKAKILVRSNEQSGALARDIRVGPIGKLPVYVFRLDTDVLSQFDGNTKQPTGDSVNNAVTRTDGLGPGTDPPEPLSLVSLAVPGSDEPTGDSPSSALTRTDTVATGLGEAVVPGVPGSECKVAQEDAMNGEEKQRNGAGTSTSTTALDWDALLAEAGDDREVLLDLWYLAQADDPDNVVVLQRIKAAGQKAKRQEQPDAAPDTAAQSSPADKVAVTGPCPPPVKGFTAACVVIDPTGLYLPDGTRHQPPEIRDAHDMLGIGQHLNIGHPSGPGQLILTDALCYEIGLVAEADAGVAGDEARKQIATRLRALGDGFLQRARDHGWEFDHFGPETRARLKREGRTRVLDIVLAPYATLWTRGREEVTPFGAIDPDETLTQEQYAAQAARLMGHLAHLLNRPWRSSAVQAGFDLFDAAQRARKKNHGHVLSIPGRLPELTGGTTARDLVPAVTWARWTPERQADDTDQARIGAMTHAVHLDRIAAWPSSASQATLGYLTEDEPEMVHHHGADAVAALLARPEAVPAGVFRLRLPRLADPAVPPLHAGQSTARSRWLWLPHPMVSTLIRADDPTANVLGWGCTLQNLLTADEDDGEEAKQPEAWIFPKQGRILGGLWYETLRDARYRLAQYSGGGADLPETELIKHIYSGMLQSTQDTKAEAIEGKRGWHHQATWLSTVKAVHYSWQWHLLRRAIYNDAFVVHVDIDEIVILTTDPTTVSLGTAAGKIGQYRPKKVRQLTDHHRGQLAAGTPASRLEGGEVA